MRLLQFVFIGIGALLLLLGTSVAYLGIICGLYPQAFYSALAGCGGMLYNLWIYSVLDKYRHKKKR
jgi:hypothetical protein